MWFTTFCERLFSQKFERKNKKIKKDLFIGVYFKEG